MRNATPIQPEWRDSRLICGVSRLRAAQASEVCDDRPHSRCVTGLWPVPERRAPPPRQSCHRHHLLSPENCGR